MKILIVDDSKPISIMVKDMLTQNKIDSSPAYNGKEAIDLLQKGEKFDMILLDWNMPVLDGPGFLTSIRQNKIKCPPIVMMTTENSEEKIKKALDLGAVEYIMKPFTQDILMSKIEMITTMMQ